MRADVCSGICMSRWQATLPCGGIAACNKRVQLQAVSHVCAMQSINVHACRVIQVRACIRNCVSLTACPPEHGHVNHRNAQNAHVYVLKRLQGSLRR